MNYELRVGIEAHFELLTNSKLFCGCSTRFGADANTQCCPVCIGLPGALPVMNKRAVELAVKAGLATHCSINNFSNMDRKNYFYPDLAKGYQVTQCYKPICKDGYIRLDNDKKICIERIHIEEDVGKLVYKGDDILIDYNRSGIPLLEVVSEPDMTSVGEVREYIEKLIDLMRYVGVSDCKMQEGSLRCDVNVSVTECGSGIEGTRIELKNLNSVKFITKAIEFEVNRQIDILKSGDKVLRETRRYDELTKKTEPMRTKESMVDYRYFKEPDLASFDITAQEIDAIKKDMPRDFDDRMNHYVNDFDISPIDAKNLLKYKNAADYFDEISSKVKNKKLVLNFILGPIFSKLNTQEEKQMFNLDIKIEDFTSLCIMVEDKKIDFTVAKEILNKALDTDENLCDLIFKYSHSEHISDKDLTKLCKDVLSQNENAVSDFRRGKTQSLQYLIGKVIKQTKLPVDIKKIESILEEQLSLFCFNK